MQRKVCCRVRSPQSYAPDTLCCQSLPLSHSQGQPVFHTLREALVVFIPLMKQHHEVQLSPFKGFVFIHVICTFAHTFMFWDDSVVLKSIQCGKMFLKNSQSGVFINALQNIPEGEL